MENLADGLVQIKKMRLGHLSSKEQHELMNVTEQLIYLSEEQKQKISELEDLVNELKGELRWSNFSGQIFKESLLRIKI
jgi:hypothetical protein